MTAATGWSRSAERYPSLLVGREREQATLREQLSAALAGHGTLVLVGGEAGIGKTTLAEDLCREASGRGATALVGRCYDLSETPPYGPWLDLFARLPGEAPPIGELLGGNATGGVGQTARFGRMRDFLAAAAARQPLVVILDDLHWADPASLDLLRFLARELARLPLLIVAIYRTEELIRHHPLYPLLPILVRESAAVRLDLRLLDDEAIRTWLRARYHLAEQPEARLVTYLQARAEGNPFFTGELLRTLEETRLLRAADGGAWTLGDLSAAGVPPLLRQVLEGRLGRLGEEARDRLIVAAVIGQEVPLALWAAVAGVAEGALLDVVERAVAAYLLAATGDGMGVRFVHALVREALYEGLLPPRRRDWHRRVAEALLAERAPDPDAMAYHLQRAGDPRAVEWLRRAGRRAEGSAPRIAAERYSAALALLPDDGDPVRRGWLLLNLSSARFFDDPHEGIGHLREAIRLAQAADDRALLAHARYSLGFHLTGIGDQRQGLPEMVAGVTALEALTPEEQAHVQDAGYYRSGLHLATLALRLAHMGYYEEAQAMARQAIARGDEENGNFALAEAYGALGRVAEALDLRARGYATLRRSNRWFGLGIYLWFGLQRLAIPYHADQLDQRRQLAAAATATFARSLETGVQGEVEPRLGSLPLLALEGEWAEARALALTVEAGSRTYRPGAVSVLADIAFAQGDRALLMSLVRKTLPAGPGEEPGGCFILTGFRLQRLAALQAIGDGDLATARDWLEARDRWLAWSGAVQGQAEGQLAWATYHRATGDLAKAREHAGAALARATEPRQPLALLAAQRLLGELDTASGQQDSARTHLDAALALADACAAPYERALTLLVLAELQLAAGAQASAVAPIEEARAILVPLAARPALDRADALTARLLAPPRPTVYPAGLTAREVEVLRLLAEGKSNRTIADELFLSLHTVERHVANLYAKTGAHGRAAATAFAHRHGLARRGTT